MEGEIVCEKHAHDVPLEAAVCTVGSCWPQAAFGLSLWFHQAARYFFFPCFTLLDPLYFASFWHHIPKIELLFFFLPWAGLGLTCPSVGPSRMGVLTNEQTYSLGWIWAVSNIISHTLPHHTQTNMYSMNTSWQMKDSGRQGTTVSLLSTIPSCNICNITDQV